jgi:hypothetical protein
MDTKKRYINTLSAAKDVFDSVNNNPDSGFLTFQTSNGYVMGKIVTVEPFEFEKENDFVEKFTQDLQDGKDVNLFNITAGLYLHGIGVMEKENDTKVIPDNKAIILEDVSIYDNLNQNPIVTTNTYVLFSDQIIGMLPGKIK